MTADSTINLDLITKQGVDRLLRYLPLFNEPNRVFGTPIGLVKTGERDFETCGGSIGDQERAFLEACYEKHFVQPFDWHECHLLDCLEYGTIQAILTRLAHFRAQMD